MLIKYYVFVGNFFLGGGGAKAGKIQNTRSGYGYSTNQKKYCDYGVHTLSMSIEHKMYRFKDLRNI